MLADSYAAADLNDIGVHILRSGLVHSLRMRLRAQEWIRRHPEITRGGHRRADRRGRDDAQRDHAAAATSGRRQPLSLRVRLGGGRGRPQAGLRLVDAERTPASRSARSARRRRANWPPSCSPSTRCTPASPKRRSSSCPTRSCRTCPSRARTCPRTGRGSTSRTSRRRTRSCTGCCSSCSGRSGSAG